MDGINSKWHEKNHIHVSPKYAFRKAWFARNKPKVMIRSAFIIHHWTIPAKFPGPTHHPHDVSLSHTSIIPFGFLYYWPQNLPFSSAYLTSTCFGNTPVLFDPSTIHCILIWSFYCFILQYDPLTINPSLRFSSWSW